MKEQFTVGQKPRGIKVGTYVIRDGTGNWGEVGLDFQR